ncbi:MAG: hypothetical protein M1313_06575 [Nitrospirae bacterium]|nr:hypothetical protein [Nitrospirota bacterium]
MTAAERQEKRPKAVKGALGLGKGLCVTQTHEKRLALERLARNHGLTKAAMVARLILEADRDMIRSLIDDKPGMERSMGRA